MATGVYNYEEQCAPSRKHRPLDAHQKLFQLVPLNRPLEFIVIDVFETLFIFMERNRFVTVITVWYSKWTRAVPESKAAAMLVVTIV